MRVERNIFVDGRYVAYQSGIVGIADTAIGAIKKVLDKVFEDEPVRGFCYHIDCDEDRCRCWSDLPALREHLKGSKEMQRKVGLDVSVDKDRVVKMRVIHFEDTETIVCDCNDPSCEKEGEEGEVAGHIENCSCGHCHNQLGKL